MCQIFKLCLGDTQLCWESQLKITLFGNVFEIKLCLLQKGRKHLLELSIPEVFNSQGHRIQITSEHSPKFLKSFKKRHSWSEVLKTWPIMYMLSYLNKRLGLQMSSVLTVWIKMNRRLLIDPFSFKIRSLFDVLRNLILLSF